MALMTQLWDPDEGDPLEGLNDCQCGHRRWEEYGHSHDPEDRKYRCSECGTGPSVETLYEVTQHVARKDSPRHGIVAGDTYRRIARGGYFPFGKRWLSVTKQKVTVTVA